jgi:hypothetical protein
LGGAHVPAAQAGLHPRGARVRSDVKSGAPLRGKLWRPVASKAKAATQRRLVCVDADAAVSSSGRREALLGTAAIIAN